MNIRNKIIGIAALLALSSAVMAMRKETGEIAATKPVDSIDVAQTVSDGEESNKESEEKKLSSTQRTLREGETGNKKATITEDMITNKTANGYDLTFNSLKGYQIREAVVEGKTIKYRAYENIVYVKNPVDIGYQTINIYIPEEYFNNKSIGNYNKDTAPIFLPNSVGGYMPGAASVPGTGRDGNPDASMVALSKGLVVAAPGARGRTLEKNGKYTGKAPSVIVDLKAAVRYIRHNDKNMPGNSERIISNGTSAGGAISALLGATGNSRDYEPYLKEVGALEERDDIFAVSSYCPITNLDISNEAYEWMFGGINTYQKMSITMLDYNVERKTVEETLTEAEKILSPKLKALFPGYVNSLKLKGKNGELLTLDKDGNGKFKEYVKKYIVDSANKAISIGKDLSQYEFLIMKNNKVIDIDFTEYVNSIGRIKSAGAFDSLDASTGENNLFGDWNTDNKHFTKFMEEYTKNEIEKADSQIVKMMNPMNYIGEKNVITSKYWRIRHGGSDRDTALAIPVILALKLENSDKSVDFSVPWGQGHGGDYDLNELFTWINNITK